ncbi:glycosyltransferase family 4 protein, partial [Hydrogenimonas sp.]
IVLMKKEGVDIVHSNSLTSSIYFVFWCKCFGLKFVAHNHLIRSGTIYKMVYRYIALFADEIICVSEAVKKNWINEGVPAKKLTVVYNGLPDDFF